MNSGVSIILAILGVFGASGGVGALLLVRGQRHKLSAETDESVAATAKVLLGVAKEDLLDPLREELQRSRATEEGLRNEVAQLRTAVTRLTHAVSSASYVYDAIWQPGMTLNRLRALVPRPPGEGDDYTS